MKHSNGAGSHEPKGGGVFGSPVFWIAVIVVAVGAMIWLALPASRTPVASPKPDFGGAAPTGEALPEKVIGRWLRNDGGGYSIEIRSVLDGGKFEAAYFNPSPINVSRAEWGREEGKLRVFIELRDRNYDGATYTLLYDAPQDRLAGVYFQPALGQSFAVEFEREK